MIRVKLVGICCLIVMVEKYHALKGFPDYEFPTGEIELNETKHAKKRISEYNNRYAELIRLPDKIRLFDSMYSRNPVLATANDKGEKTKPYVFELCFEYGNLARIGVRFHASDKYDMVLHIDVRNGNICTVWINEKNRCKVNEVNMKEYESP
jgi:hypothetical protein